MKTVIHICRVGAYSETHTVGVDIQNNTYTVYGSPAQKLSTTALVDIGRAVGRLAILALDPKTASTVPDEVRISGDIVSYEDIRDTVARVKGVEKGTIVTKDLHALKETIRKDPGKNFLDYLKWVLCSVPSGENMHSRACVVSVVIGEGKAEFSPNDNELVNPGQKFWKWRTVEDFLRGQ